MVSFPKAWLRHSTDQWELEVLSIGTSPSPGRHAATRHPRRAPASKILCRFMAAPASLGLNMTQQEQLYLAWTLLLFQKALAGKSDAFGT